MNATEAPNRIREWRNRRRMSLAELGEAVGLSRSEISKLESGSRRVRADHLVVLAKALKVSPEDLMDKETVRDMLGDHPQQRYEAAATVMVAQARRHEGKIILSTEPTAVTVEAPPQLAHLAGAYAFYMPDTSLEPRVPVGALLYVHPMLPPRAGDLAVIALDDGPLMLASVERQAAALLALAGPGMAPVDLSNGRVVSAHRVVGMWFP